MAYRGGYRGRGRGRGAGWNWGSERAAKARSDVLSTKRLLKHADSEVSDLSELSSTFLAELDLRTESRLTKRLFKEYILIKDLDLPYVCVAPLPSNFTEWHGNLKGPEGTTYEGGVFHFSIQFNTEYPASPPTVKILTRIGHPCANETSGKVDLDIFGVDQQIANKTSQRYNMWSPTYNVASILLALEAFLFEGTAEIALQNITNLSDYNQEKKKWESVAKFSVEQSLRFSCSVCKHRPMNYWPKNHSHMDDQPPSLDSLYLENAVCFYTMRPHSEVPLGVGINCSKDLRTGKVQSIRCVPDIISLNAFQGYKIKTAWGQGFSNWFPIYIQCSSPDRSIYLAKRSLSNIYSGSPNDFQPSMALDFFPRILSHLTVCFANSEEGGDAVRYLHTYCYMLRMFLEFLSLFPELIIAAHQDVKGFISDPAKRHTDVTAAIGHMVVFLPITETEWKALAPAYLSESMDRNARRIIRKYPELDTMGDAKVEATRISKSYSAYNVSGLRFLMMQLSINKIIKLSEQDLDLHHSLIPKEVEAQLLAERKAVQGVNNFMMFYEAIGEEVPSEEQLQEMLRQAILNSQSKHYHGDKGIEVLSPEEFEKQRLGAIRPLQEMVTEEGTLHNDEEKWKSICETRFGLTDLPASYDKTITQPWKHLYLQHNLQELVSKLNDNPDFKLLYQTLELSKTCLSRFDLVTFSPDNIRSNYYFLSQIIQLLPLLTHLTMSKGVVGLGEKGFRELVKGMAKSSGALKVLDMPHLDITEAHVSKFAETQLTSNCLTCLNFAGNNLSTKGSEMLAQLMMKHHSLPNLEELKLKACKITEEGMKALAEGLLVKRKIKKLDLSKNACGSGLALVIKNLSYSPSIEELILTSISFRRGSALSSSFQEALDKLFLLTVSLKKLSFWNIDSFSHNFNKANMKSLASNGTIEHLDLSSTGFRVTETAPFGTVLVSKNCVIRELDLSCSSLTPACCKFIVEQANGHTSPVTVLNLSTNERLFRNLSPKLSKAMVTMFSHTFVNVTHLDISHCGLVSQSIEVIGKVLAANTCLENLNLSFNHLGKHGARIVANGLASNTTLQVLRLDKNNIGAAGANYLAAVLEKPSCILRELHLFCNFVDVPGAIAISKALHSNTHLELLDLGLNKVRKRGAAAIVEMLGVNQTLKTLCLKFNFIPDPWAIKIARKLIDSPHCKVSTLKLAGNSLQYETLVTIVTALNESPRAVTFDLAGRAEYREPERMERTVYVSPLSTNVTPDMLKKMFYSKKCGAIKSVKIEKHRKKKASFNKAKYALVEFAHKDSVELAVDLVAKREAKIGNQYQTIATAGLNDTSTVRSGGGAQHTGSW